MPTETTDASHRDGDRDARVARLLGVFFGVLALPVLAAAVFATSPVDVALNLAAGGALLIAAAVFLWAAKRLSTGAEGETR